MSGQMLAMTLVGVALVVVLVRQARGAHIFSFPVLFCGSWLIFVIASFVEFALSDSALYRFYLEEGVIDAALTMIALSVVAGLVGHAIGARSMRLYPTAAAAIRPATHVVRLMTFNSLVIGALSYGAFFLLIRHGGGIYQYIFLSGAYAIRWEGAPVYYVFVVRFIYVAIVIQLWLWARTRVRLHLIFALALSIIPFINIFFIFRRSEVIVIGAIYGYFLVNYFGWRMGRLTIMGAAAVVALIMRLFPLLRTEEAKVRPWSDLLVDAIAPRETFDNSEIGSSLYRIYATIETGSFEYGALLWNALVKQFLPGTLVGDFKNTLLIPTVTAFESSEVNFFFYLSPVGFAQAFQQFWFFGALIFFILGFWSSRLERRRFASPRTEIFSVLILPFLITGITADLSVLFTRILTYGVLVLIFVPRTLSRLTKMPCDERPPGLHAASRHTSRAETESRPSERQRCLI